VSDLGATGAMLMDAAHKLNTKRTYTSAQTRFLNFCELYKLNAMPCTEDTLILYVSFLFEEGLTASTIRVYLSAVRSMHVFAGVPYPTEMLRVRLALKGAVRQTPQPVRKLPITIDILKQMLKNAKHRFDSLLLTSVMTLAFFGCLRLSEFCLPDTTKFSSNLHVCMSDVNIDLKTKTLTLFLRRSKTDSDNKGVSIYIGCSREPTCCAFCSMCAYLKFRNTIIPNNDDAPLFLLPGGTVLAKNYMISITRLLLCMSGYNPALYSGHSFRAGAATTAGDSGFKDWELKMLGRWKSSAYNIYLRNPKVTVSFASRLVSSE
jgi:hypothetical protein